MSALECKDSLLTVDLVGQLELGFAVFTGLFRYLFLRSPRARALGDPSAPPRGVIPGAWYALKIIPISLA